MSNKIKVSGQKKTSKAPASQPRGTFDLKTVLSKKPIIIAGVAGLALVVALLFFVLQPTSVKLYVSPERLVAYEQVLGDFDGEGSLNVELVSMESIAQFDARQDLRELVLSEQLPSAVDKRQQKLLSFEKVQEFDRAIYGFLRPIFQSGAMPLSLNPLMEFSFPSQVGPAAKARRDGRRRWSLAGKDDQLLGLVVAWLASASDQPEQSLRDLVMLGRNDNFQNQAATYSLEDSLAQIFTYGKQIVKTPKYEKDKIISIEERTVIDTIPSFVTDKVKGLLLSLSQFRKLPSAVQTGLIPKALPLYLRGTQRVLGASAQVRVVLAPQERNDGGVQALLKRLANVEAQRVLADASLELPAIIASPVRDAADDVAKRMLLAASQVVWHWDNRLLPAARVVLTDPKKLEQAIADL